MANSAFEHTPSFTTPNTSTNDAIVRWDGTAGAAIQNSTKVTIDDNGTMGVPITQSSHPFQVGDVVRSSGSDGAYAKAQANNAANAEVVGIVIARADDNNFTLSVSSRISVAAAVPNNTAGTVLFLSPTSAGDLQTAEPSTAGQISKPVAVVTTANSEMILLNYRGESISTGYNNWDVNGTELILDVDGDTSITADTDDQIDVKISGADDFRFTANNLNVLSGSTLTIDSGATITNSGTASGFGGGAIAFVNSQTTEATTTSTSVADLIAISSVSIATTIPIVGRNLHRKASGALNQGGCGLKVNSTVVSSPVSGNQSDQNMCGGNGGENSIASGHAIWELSTIATNYDRSSGVGQYVSKGSGFFGQRGVSKAGGRPNATTTSLTINGISTSASSLIGADEFKLYTVAIS